METDQEEERVAPSVVLERDRTIIDKVMSESCESQVKEGEEIRKETIKEAELEEATEVLKRDCTKVGDYHWDSDNSHPRGA